MRWSMHPHLNNMWTPLLLCALQTVRGKMYIFNILETYMSWLCNNIDLNVVVCLPACKKPIPTYLGDWLFGLEFLQLWSLLTIMYNFSFSSVQCSLQVTIFLSLIQMHTYKVVTSLSEFGSGANCAWSGNWNYSSWFSTSSPHLGWLLEPIKWWIPINIFCIAGPPYHLMQMTIFLGQDY